MKKRWISLFLVLLALTLVIAPVAMADHCRKCNTQQRCVIAVTGGKPVCDDSSGTCVLQGLTCTGPHPLIDIDDPFAADFIVASVERLDEPQPAPDRTRVASLETPQTAER